MKKLVILLVAPHLNPPAQFLCRVDALNEKQEIVPVTSCSELKDAMTFERADETLDSVHGYVSGHFKEKDAVVSVIQISVE